MGYVTHDVDIFLRYTYGYETNLFIWLLQTDNYKIYQCYRKCMNSRNCIQLLGNVYNSEAIYEMYKILEFFKIHTHIS